MRVPVGDELDLQIVHALQIAPRASWTDIGGVLGLAPTTVTRRWEALTRSGNAWITAYVAGTHSRVAFVHLRTEPHSRATVSRDLNHASGTITIDEVTGDFDTMVIVGAPSLSTLHQRIRAICRTEGVQASNVMLSTHLLVDGSRWRMDALSKQQVALLGELEPAGPKPPARKIDPLDRDLALLLDVDARMPAAALAARLGVSTNTVRRRLAHLIDSGWLTLRCDATRSVSGHELCVMLWLTVPPEQLLDCARTLAAQPEIRFIATIAGRNNLSTMVWLRKPEDLPPFEQRIAGFCPRAQVTNRTITLRAVKQVGRIFDDEGRVENAVPLDFWEGDR